MKTKFKYIEFVAFGTKPESYKCVNRKQRSELGQVGWYKKWGRYVFLATSTAVIFSDDCLDDISAFIKQLYQEEIPF